MKRSDFLKTLSLLPFAGYAADASVLKKLNDAPSSDRTPLLFLGHGSPMNGINDNVYSNAWKELGQQLEAPKAIICVSAHWLTKGTFVTALEEQRTIHSFSNFPKELFDVQYNPKGNVLLAKETRDLIKTTQVGLSHDWGLDHGAWTVIRRLYPEANIPVIQLSVDYSKSAEHHYNLGKQLSALRKKGVLILSSGNIIHNLYTTTANGKPYDWALEAKEKFNQFITDKNHKPLLKYQSLGEYANNAIPTPDHFFPLLYILALQEKDENVRIFNDDILSGSLSMTSLHIQKG